MKAIYPAVVAVVAAGALLTMGHPALKAAPALVGSNWIGSKPKSAKFTAPVTVVFFWAADCINCHHNLPAYSRAYDKYKGRGLNIVGIQTPELADERDPGHVLDTVKENKIAYPILFDGDEKNWNRWHIDAWPTTFLVDGNGKIRDSYVGEFDETEPQWDAKIQAILKEAGR